MPKEIAMIGAAIAAIGGVKAGTDTGKKIYSTVKGWFGGSEKYESKMKSTWEQGALDAVWAHRDAGSTNEYFRARVAAGSDAVAPYMPSEIWNPQPVTAPAGNVIPGCTVQGPRPAGWSEADWHARDPSQFPYPGQAIANVTGGASGIGGGPALAGIGGIGGNTSTLLIVGILAFVLLTRRR